MKIAYEIDEERIVKRIKRSFGHPMINVELRDEDIKGMIQDAVDHITNRFSEGVYEIARDEAVIALKNVRAKFVDIPNVTDKVV